MVYFVIFAFNQTGEKKQEKMNKEKKETIHQAITERIKVMEKSVETFKKLSAPVSPDNAIGRITRMEAINSKSINEASLAKSKHNLNQLKKSLKRINDPDFGYCNNCEESIAYKRLLIMPEALFCVACAGKINNN
jgi:DnaK suppressor protein